MTRRPLRDGLGARALVPALTVVFGMQILRILLPLLVYVLRDRIGLQALHLGGIALVLFALSFLVGPLLRSVGAGRLALVTLVGLAVVRVAVQVWQGDPLVDLGLAMAGTLLFLLYLPAGALAAATSAPPWPGGDARGPAADQRDPLAVAGTPGPFALGFLFGLGIDAALNGILGTYDLAWRSGVVPGAVIFALALAVVYFAVSSSGPSARGRAAVGDGEGATAAVAEGPSAGPATAAARGARPWPWLALGPLLALEMLLFQNVARLATLADLPTAGATLLVVVGHAAGLVVAATALPTTAPARPAGASRAATRVALALATAAAALLVLSVAPAAPRGAAAALLFVAGQAALSLLAVHVLGAAGATGGSARPGRLAASHGGGMVLLVLFLFLAYSGYDIALPFSADVLPPVAAVVVGVCALGALAGRGGTARETSDAASHSGGASPQEARDGARAASQRRALPSYLAPGALLILAAVVSVAQLVTYHPPGATPGSGDSVRVMTFNLHNGFATDGRLDLEAIARVIEEQEPDILALQEVSRGWVVNGTVDMYTWLSRRLDMPGVYGPTAGPLWGNALLSRLPLDDHRLVSLPTDDLLLRRGFIEAVVEAGGGAAPLYVIATHYHHPEDGGPVRLLESDALLSEWNGAPRTIVMGDLNAVPGDGEIEMLREAGLVEVLAAAGVAPGYTFSSDEPFQRIDYIWVTPDLLPPGSARPSDVRVTAGTVSDHLGIAATLPAGR